MEKKEVYVVPHSHWDAEWYFTCEDSHILLVENMDYLMDLLEKDECFASYTFDGLSIILDDYMEIRPEQKQRLQRLIQEKRILVGPWYTQTDTLLVRTESLIRNLIAGVRKAEEFGHSMDIGYLPDVFGQHAYLPSIFTDLNISSSILQRGVYTDQIREDLNFIWKSPNGKTIPTNCLYFGYGPGKFLSAEEGYVNNRLLPILKTLTNMNTHTNRILLPSGGDQVLANAAFPGIVENLNELDIPYHFHMSDYETYMKDVWENNSFDNVIEGELIACQKSRIHRTCHSTRVDMKQQTWYSEYLLIDYVEPLCVIADKLKVSYPKPFLEEMWKKVFTSHAHNGIEASNADQVNANVKNRLASVERSALSLLNLVKKKITKKIVNELLKENIFVVFNCDIHEQSGLVEGVVFTKNKDFRIVDDEDDCIYSVTSTKKLDGGQRVVVTAQGEKLEKVDDYYRSEILLEPGIIPAMGYKTFLIEECDKQMIAKEGLNIENKNYNIYLENGKLILIDKRTQKIVENFLQFVDEADYGDEFDFAPLPNDKPIFNTTFTITKCEKFELSEKMELITELYLPCDLEERQSSLCNNKLFIHTILELRKDEKIVRVHHDINNNIKDHRLRVYLRTPNTDLTHSYADQGFSILKRESTSKYLKNWRELGFVEKPMPIYTMENIAFTKGENEFHGVITKGIKEYEVLLEEQVFALTLYRSVGLLGRDDTAWRPGRASGINNKVVETIDAQLLTDLHFDYALWVDEAVSDVEIFTQIDAYRNHIMSYQMQALNTFEERLERFNIPLDSTGITPRGSLFKVDNEHIFLSACYREEDSIYLRLYNPQDHDEILDLTQMNYHIETCTLLGTKESNIQDSVCIKAKDYITLRLYDEKMEETA